MKPVTIVKRFLRGQTLSISLPLGIDDEIVSNPSAESWLLISQSSTWQVANLTASTKEAERAKLNQLSSLLTVIPILYQTLSGYLF